ncbi:angiotensin-converting enzyme-like protein Ace3 [Procambarus clarkii]|uniref:angiotensin-converting enzyme-like protein Ace3 n=1 Tax=Procambarus clarkii TaxID=6728 RepID=UPI0037440D7F
MEVPQILMAPSVLAQQPIQQSCILLGFVCDNVYVVVGELGDGGVIISVQWEVVDEEDEGTPWQYSRRWGACRRYSGVKQWHDSPDLQQAAWGRLRVLEADRLRRWAADSRERRMLHLITRGPRYTTHQARSLTTLVSRMRLRYSSLTLTHNRTVYRGQRDLTALMRTSRDPQLLLWAWRAWHDALGPPIRPLFTQAVRVMNQGARSAGYADMGVAWREELELGRDVNVWAVVERVYSQVADVYTLVHAHVRQALVKQYGRSLVDPTAPIPAHLVGDLWGQDWSALLELILPDPHHTPAHHTSHTTNHTTRDMVQEAEQFFLGLGFPPLSHTFWFKSVLGKAPGDGACQPRALDMFAPGDYRMMVCEAGVEEGAREAYHELGHVHYFQAYAHQPTVFRDGVNSAFHETVGDTLQLAAMTTSPHLTSPHPHLLRKSVIPAGVELRGLLLVALTKLPLFAFARVMDEWRWRVFQGTIREEAYNRSWWLLKQQYQGLASPTPRSEEHFDPAAKFHLADNTPYVRYLVAVVAQFQVHRGLCEATHGRPLTAPAHTCSIAGSRPAGTLLRQVMGAGSSVRWEEVLERVTGTTHLDASAMLEYLAPLTDWLHHHARLTNLTLGW